MANKKILEVTEREHSEKWFRLVVESAPNALLLVGRDGRITLANARVETVFGYKSQELIGQPIEVLVPERFRNGHQDHVAGFFAAPQARPLGVGRDLFGLRKDGTEVPVEIGLTPVETAEGIFALASVIDITERKRQEAELALKSEELVAAYTELNRTTHHQLETKDQILSHVSHELRTPLNAAHQFVTILQDGLAGELNAQQKEYLKIIFRNLKQLQTMISDVLEVTRAHSGKLTIEPKPIQADELIVDLLRTLRSPAAEKKITMAWEGSTSPTVYADPARVRQIITNLLDNALKFTPAGGKITVRARVWEKDSNFVCISVSDTGRGIAPEVCKKVFERLYQVDSQSDAARKGLGLGLCISRELVIRMGGEIWVESEAGKGSTFSFTLPIYKEQKAATPTRKA